MKQDWDYLFGGLIILCVGLLSKRDLVAGQDVDSSGLQLSSLPKKQNGVGKGLPQNQVIDDDDDDNFKRPWEINKNICPPVLCKWLNNRNTEEGDEPESFPFFEGDVVLDKELEHILRPKRTTKHGVAPRRRRWRTRAIVKPVTRLWPFGIIPYEIDPNLGNRTQKLIHKAIQHFANYTCIKFRPRTDKDVDYIYYIYQPGCWSHVGRMGGKQYISLGEDCDKLGIIVHETSHALGFWHEQSRQDRDRYVKVIKKNIDPNSLEQFERRSELDSASRGYAYDYNSIMHYGGSDFTDNGQPTIKLIGIGKRFQFRIGQRVRLSDLDIAQLNDMYYCNRKEAERHSCRDGWMKFRSSCYGFFPNETRSFFPASRACRSMYSRLVIINDAEEDAFLKSHLKNHYSQVTRWRTGAVRLTPSGEYVWYRAGSGAVHLAMNYSAWPSESFSVNATSLVLARVNRTQSSNGNLTRPSFQFEWRGEEKGSGWRPLNYSYPFICEGRAQIDCFKNDEPHGRDYRGNLSYTSEGIKCQRWSKHYPHNHTIVLDREEGIGDHNHCRNPYGMRLQPWCFTLHKNILWQYCDVPVCKHFSYGTSCKECKEKLAI